MTELLSMKLVPELAIFLDGDTNSPVPRMYHVGAPDRHIVASDAPGQQRLVTILEAHACSVTDHRRSPYLNQPVSTLALTWYQSVPETVRLPSTEKVEPAGTFFICPNAAAGSA